MTYFVCDSDGFVGDLATTRGLEDLMVALGTEGIYGDLFDNGCTEDLESLITALESASSTDNYVDSTIKNLLGLVKKCSDIIIITDGVESEGVKEFIHGGSGSGNWGHAGRPGEVGGSVGEGGGGTGGSGWKASVSNSSINDETRGAFERGYRGIGRVIGIITQKGMGENVNKYASDNAKNKTLKYYCSDGFKETNNVLRDNPMQPKGIARELVLERISRLDTLIQEAPEIPESTILYRGIGPKRGQKLTNSEIGDICEDKGFQSHTTDPMQALYFSGYAYNENDEIEKTIVRAITGKQTKGMMVLNAATKDEREVLIKRGTKWKIAEKDRIITTEGNLTYGKGVKINIITVVPV
jgi:hypothetical protein